MFCASIS